MTNPSRWEKYYQITKTNPPSPLLIKAVTLLPHAGSALDLGSGAGRDTQFLLKKGFQVTAVDAEDSSKQILRKLPHQERLTIVQSRFEDFIPEQYDLINAAWTLPFIKKDSFDDVFARIKHALNSNGIFTGQLFGVHDEWNTPQSSMTFHTKEQIESLLSDMEILSLEEEDEDKTTADGTPKHWHVFHIIARKK